jgi:hypothetical protein
MKRRLRGYELPYNIYFLKKQFKWGDILVSHLHPAARQFCRSTYTITDNTIK